MRRVEEYISSKFTKSLSECDTKLKLATSSHNNKAKEHRVKIQNTIHKFVSKKYGVEVADMIMPKTAYTPYTKLANDVNNNIHSARSLEVSRLVAMCKLNKKITIDDLDKHIDDAVARVKKLYISGIRALKKGEKDAL